MIWHNEHWRATWVADDDLAHYELEKPYGSKRGVWILEISIDISASSELRVWIEYTSLVKAKRDARAAGQRLLNMLTPRMRLSAWAYAAKKKAEQEAEREAGE